MSKRNQKSRVNIDLSGEINGSYGAGRAVAAVKGNQSAERFLNRATHQTNSSALDVNSAGGEVVAGSTSAIINTLSKQQENMALYRNAGKAWDADKKSGNLADRRGRRAGNVRVVNAANAIRSSRKG